MVIEVILAGHLRARRLQHTSQGITHSRPTGTAEVDRAGGVSRDKLQVNLLTRKGIVRAVLRASAEDLRDDLALGVGSKADINETRAGNVGLCNSIIVCQGLCQPAAQLARIRTGLLGHL